MIKKAILSVAISIYTILIATSFTGLYDNLLIPYRLKDKWGYCNHDKKIIIPCIYDETYPFFGLCTKEKKLVNCDLARIKINNKFGFVNYKGELKIPAIYDKAGDFKFGCAHVKIDSKTIEIDTAGNTIQCPMTDGVGDGFGNSTKIFKTKKNKFGLLSPKKDTIIKPEYDSITKVINFSCYYSDTATVLSYLFSEELGFTLKKKKLIGYADKDGKLIIAPKYTEIKHYAETDLLFIKTTDNKTGYLNAKDGTEYFEN